MSTLLAALGLLLILALVYAGMTGKDPDE